jgi:hypothetical protein
MAPARSFVILAAVFVGLLVLAFVIGWPGIQRSVLQTSGTRETAEGRALTDKERRDVTEARARELLATVIAYRAKYGALPQSLDALMPEFLSEIPKPVTSTMAFELAIPFDPKDGGFIIRYEPWPNTSYERYWINEWGELRRDT